MTTKAHIKATTKYEKKAYFKTLVRFPASYEEIIRANCGESLNGFIVQAVREKIERESGTSPEAEPKEEKTSAKESAKDKTKAEKLRKSLSNLGYSEEDIQKAIEKL